MLKKSRKGFKDSVQENEETIYFEWKESNLIRVIGKFATMNNNLTDSCRQNKSLIVTKNTMKYRGIRSIEKEFVCVQDIKMIEDILEIYPDYGLVMFDETIHPVNQREFYQALVKVTKKFENVIFVWASQTKTTEKNGKAFFGEKNAFLRSI